MRSRFLAGLVLLTAFCQELPKPANYRALEVSASQGTRLEFGFILRPTCMSPWDAVERTTFWRCEMDLDTLYFCLCGARGYVFKTTTGADTLRTQLLDREGVIFDTFAAAPNDTVVVHLSMNWVPRPD
ncbi:hypothetical protein FJY71_03135 [candidate division WOR-3 bacterium]|nr:hypothetical protein [candidate division WOR-3 bacterium]